jgi:hypothetical protein
MSNRLSFARGSSYTGTNADQPPNWSFNERSPTTYDTQNVSLGDLWMNTVAETVFVLVSLEGDMSSAGPLATWLPWGGNVGQGILSLEGNTGGKVYGDITANVNVVGTTPIEVTGDPGTNTLTISSDGTLATTYTAEDATTATPSGGILNLIGGGSSHITTTAVGNTVYWDLFNFTPHAPVIGSLAGGLTDLGAMTNGQLVIGHTGADPALATLTAGANITITNGAGSITIASTGGGSGVTALLGDNGDTASGNPTSLLATPTAGSSVAFNGDNAATMALQVTDSNDNTLIGLDAGNGTLLGSFNTGIGGSTGLALTSGASNLLAGYIAGTGITTGSNNSILGTAAGYRITTGSNNTLLGRSSGSQYTSGESSNILLNNIGVVSENNVMRLGTSGSGAGQVNTAFVAGTYGVSPTGTLNTVIINSNGQLGSTAGGTPSTSFITSPATGTATPNNGVLTFAGTGGTTVSAAGSTVTINSATGGTTVGGILSPPHVGFNHQVIAPTFTYIPGTYAGVNINVSYNMITYVVIINISNLGTVTNPAATDNLLILSPGVPYVAASYGNPILVRFYYGTGGPGAGPTNIYTTHGSAAGASSFYVINPITNQFFLWQDLNALPGPWGFSITGTQQYAA